MTVTTNRIGVWYLDDIYKKTLSGYTCCQTLWSWGGSYLGRLGTNDVIDRSSPVQIPGITWNIIKASSNSGYALKNDNTLWAWGRNNPSGQLGDNTIIHRSSPVQIPGEWLTIGPGVCHALALKFNNTLWTWGNDANGQLGQGTAFISRSSPVQIPGTQWCAVEGADADWSLALKNDGTMWSWGLNTGGRTGTNSTITRSSPTQIPGNTWTKISNSCGAGYALKNDGTMWVWGQNNQGQLGVGDVINRSSPVQLPGNQWVNVSANWVGATLALKSDNTLWTWGCGACGTMGINDDAVSRSSPVQVPGTSWKEVISGRASIGTPHNLAIKSDLSLWSWGFNAPGQLGINDTINRSSPTQIPGTWVCIAPGSCFSLALKSTETSRLL